MSTFHPAPSIRHVQSGFQAIDSERMELIIQISSTGLTLSVYDELSAFFPFIENYTLQAGYNGLKTHELVARIIQSHPFTRLVYKKTRVIYVHPVYCLVPESLFEAEKASKLLDIHSGNFKEAEISYYKLPYAPIFCVSAIPEAWKRIISSVLPAAEAKHYSSLMAERVSSTKMSDESVLHIHVHDFSLDIALVTKDGVQFLNSFTYEQTDDFLYYILLVCDRLSLDRNTIICEISGEIDPESALIQSLYVYVRKIRFYAPHPSYTYAADAEGRSLPAHFFPQLTYLTYANN